MLLTGQAQEVIGVKSRGRRGQDRPHPAEVRLKTDTGL